MYEPNAFNEFTDKNEERICQGISDCGYDYWYHLKDFSEVMQLLLGYDGTEYKASADAIAMRILENPLRAKCELQTEAHQNVFFEQYRAPFDAIRALAEGRAVQVFETIDAPLCYLRTRGTIYRIAGQVYTQGLSDGSQYLFTAIGSKPLKTSNTQLDVMKDPDGNLEVKDTYPAGFWDSVAQEYPVIDWHSYGVQSEIRNRRNYINMPIPKLKDPINKDMDVTKIPKDKLTLKPFLGLAAYDNPAECIKNADRKTLQILHDMDKRIIPREVGAFLLSEVAAYEKGAELQLCRKGADT
jgi:hypothetical protein